MSKVKNWFYIIFLAAGIVLIGFLFYKIGHKKGYRAGYVQAMNDVKRDTVTVVDTVYFEKPVPEYHFIDKPIYIPVHDSTIVHQHDTTYVVLEKEVKGYSSEDYRCQISGIQPNLDWIEVYPKTTTVVNTVEVPVKRHWSFGLSAGPGIVWNGSFHAGVGIVAGVQYNF